MSLPGWVSDTGHAMQAQGSNYLASMGIYIFNRQLLSDLLQNEYVEATDFGKEIIPQSLEKYKVVSYQYEGYWTDIGNIPSFFEANLGLTKDIPDFNLFDNEKAIYTRARMLPPAKISGTTLEKTIIAEGCIINASRIENSVIGIRTRIGTGTTIVSSYLMGVDFYETIEEIEQAQSTRPCPPSGSATAAISATPSWTRTAASATTSGSTAAIISKTPTIHSIPSRKA